MNKQYLKENYTNISKIKITTILKVFKKYVPKNKVIQFFKIDVVGNNFEEYSPKVILLNLFFHAFLHQILDKHKNTTLIFVSYAFLNIMIH